MILLDTNALIWLARGHRRTRDLARARGRLYVSPASLLELQMLIEGGRIRVIDGGIEVVAADSRWAIDAPEAGAWFQAASAQSWTRDPFDRLIVAHAEHRGWKLATADSLLLERLGAARTIAL